MTNTSMTTVSNFCLQAALAAIAQGIADERVRAEAIPSLYDHRVKLKVTFLAPGELSPDEAADFAGAILRASRLAQASLVNGAEVVFA